MLNVTKNRPKIGTLLILTFNLLEFIAATPQHPVVQQPCGPPTQQPQQGKTDATEHPTSGDGAGPTSSDDETLASGEIHTKSGRKWYSCNHCGTFTTDKPYRFFDHTKLSCKAIKRDKDKACPVCHAMFGTWRAVKHHLQQYIRKPVQKTTNGHELLTVAQHEEAKTKLPTD